MNKLTIMFLTVIFLVFISIVFYLYWIFTHGELANKPFILAFEQFAFVDEPKNRSPNKGNDKYIFYNSAFSYKNKSFDVLAIPTTSEKKDYFWLISNVHDDYDNSLIERVFYITSRNEFYLPCEDLNKLSSTEYIDPVVISFLQKRCIK